MTFRLGVGLVALTLTMACAKGGDETAGVGGSSSDGGSGGVGGAGGVMGGMGGTGGEGGEPTPCAEQPCKLVAPQCGCAAGDRCTLTTPGERVCVAEGAKQSLEYCINDDCTAGNYCYNNGGTGFGGVCHQFCDADADCNTPTQGPGGICLYEVTGGGKLCTQNCDPVSNTGCKELNPGLKCDVGREIVGAMRWFTRCTNTGNVPVDGVCTSTSDCAAGTSCVNIGMPDQYCLAWCEVGGSPCTGANHSCVELTVNNQPILVGGTQYGGCLDNNL